MKGQNEEYYHWKKTILHSKKKPFTLMQIKTSILFFIIIFHLSFGYGQLFVTEQVYVLSNDTGRIILEMTGNDMPNINIEDLETSLSGPNVDYIFSEHIPKKSARLELAVHFDIKLSDFIFEEGQSFLEFTHHYEPIINKVRLHFDPSHYQLLIHYPTYIASFPKMVLDSITNQYKIPYTFSEGGWTLETNEFKAGSFIETLFTDGSHCLIKLSWLNETTVVNEMTSCEKTFFELPGYLEQGDYKIQVLSMEKTGPVLYSNDLTIMSNYFSPKISLLTDPLRLGDPVFFKLSTKIPISGCSIEILDTRMNVIHTEFMSSCSAISLGTSTIWSGTEFFARFHLYSGYHEDIVYKKLKFSDTGLVTGPKIVLDKPEYVAGETIEITVQALKNVELCESELLDDQGNIVARSESFDCTKIRLTLDETLPSGQYIVKTFAYHNGQIIGYASVTFSLKAWAPAKDTEMDLICSKGIFKINEEELPCITKQSVCFPSSAEMPLCLCFGNEDELTDMCHFGETCLEIGCEPKINIPYHIHYEKGQCVARRGDIKISCVNIGEICTGNCVCLESLQKAHPCKAGQLCQKGGCIDPEISFYLNTISPKQLYVSDILHGAKIEWVGELIEDGMPISAEGLMISGKLENLDSDSTQSYFNDGKIIIEQIFRGIIYPGVYKAQLIISNGIETIVIKRDIEIWYDEEDISVRVVSFEPGALGINELKNGYTVRLLLEILSSQGEIIRDIPSTDFFVESDTIQTKAIAVQQLGDLWSLMTTLSSHDVVAGQELLYFGVNSLGREFKNSILLNLTKQTPLRTRVLKLDPGTIENPLYHQFIGIGFDLDLFIAAEGFDSIDVSNIKIFLENYDLTGFISYMVRTSYGIQIRLSNIKLCPDPPQGDTHLRLSVSVYEEGRSAEDSAFFYLKNNPGIWTNIYETNCVSEVI